MSEVNGNKSKNKKKKNGKQSDVTCWNCFTTEGSDSDTVDVEPITLPKVREEHREKLKVYSFLASELSKPKAVSLKQKISEPYKIGKKIDAEILKQQSLDPKNVEKECNSVNHNIESCQGILDEKNISVSVTTDKKYDKVQNIEKDEPKNKLKDFPEKKIYNNFPQKISTHNVTNLKSITPPQEEISILQINKPNINNDTNENTHCILETANQNKPLSQDSLLNSKEQFSNQQLQKPEKCDYSNGKIRDDQRRSFEQTTPTTVFKLKELEKFTPLLTNKVIEKTSVEKSSEELSPYKEIPSKTSISLSNISNLNKPFQKINFTDKFVEKKAVTVPCELPKITPIKFRNINADLKIPVLKQSPAAVFTETTIEDNSTVRSKDLNEEKSVSTKNIGEISIKREGTNENTYQDKIFLENNDKDFTDSNKIVHKVQILTSTPKEKCTVVNKTPLEDVIAKSELHLSETKEEIALNSDKIDNASSNGSESGYTGSLATVQEFVIDESQEECIKNENIEKGVKDTNKDLTSSLYSLNTVNKKPPTHSSSFSTGINNVGKKPIKSLRWSTLSMVPRSVSFEDEVYMSEAVSPGHATLPRRSNSPLPHEREMDRDRFPINRSGLQARSESMASVYSGAGEGLRGSVTVKGEVQFSLLYNYRLGALEVGVKRCRDLAPVDVKRNRSDPYVKVYLLPDKSKAGKRKTKVKKNTLNPVFEETLSFVQPLASLSARTLWLSAWHADMFGRNDFLGEVTLPLADVVFDDPAPMWYKLHERTEQFDEQQGSRGDLIVGLKFELADAARGKGTLHVLVKEAKNLVATKPNGLADVFCKSYLLPERGRLAKQKTTVVRRSLNPRWEHTFTYRGLTLQELATRALELSLWDRDRLASNDFMGAVRLSLATGTYMGASVNWMDSVGKEITLWQNMMQQPNLWVEGSLPLRPQLIN